MSLFAALWSKQTCWIRGVQQWSSTMDYSKSRTVLKLKKYCTFLMLLYVETNITLVRGDGLNDVLGIYQLGVVSFGGDFYSCKYMWLQGLQQGIVSLLLWSIKKYPNNCKIGWFCTDISINFRITFVVWAILRGICIASIKTVETIWKMFFFLMSIFFLYFKHCCIFKASQYKYSVLACWHAYEYNIH